MSESGLREFTGRLEKSWRIVLKHRIYLVYVMALCLFVASKLCVVAGASKEQPKNPTFAAEFSVPLDDFLHSFNEVTRDHILCGTHTLYKKPPLTDALAMGNFRHRMHPSDDTVESSEHQGFQEQLQPTQVAARGATEAKRSEKNAELVEQTRISQREEEAARLAAAQASVQEIEQKITALRGEVERRVKAPGAELKGAPYFAAAKIKNLPASTQVVILIVTPYWFGVEAPDGRRGWIRIDQLEPLL